MASRPRSRGRCASPRATAAVTGTRSVARMLPRRSRGGQLARKQLRSPATETRRSFWQLPWGSMDHHETRAVYQTGRAELREGNGCDCLGGSMPRVTDQKLSLAPEVAGLYVFILDVTQVVAIGPITPGKQHRGDAHDVLRLHRNARHDFSVPLAQCCNVAASWSRKKAAIASSGIVHHALRRVPEGTFVVGA